MAQPTPTRSPTQTTAQRTAPGWATSSPTPRAAVAAVPPAQNNVVSSVAQVQSTATAPASSTVTDPSPPPPAPSDAPATAANASSSPATSQPLPAVIHVADPGIAAFLRRATEAATRRTQTPVPETTASTAGGEETWQSAPAEDESAAKKRPPSLDLDAANSLPGGSVSLSLSNENEEVASAPVKTSILPSHIPVAPGTSSSAAIDLTVDSPATSTPNATIGDADLSLPSRADQSQADQPQADQPHGVFPAAHMSAEDYAFGTTDSATLSSMPAGASTVTTEPPPVASTSAATASPAQSIPTATSTVQQGLTPTGAAPGASLTKQPVRPSSGQSSQLQHQTEQGSLTPQHAQQRAQWLTGPAAQRGQGSQSTSTPSSQWSPQLIAASHQPQPQQQRQQQQSAQRTNSLPSSLHAPQQADSFTPQQLAEFMQRQAAAAKRLQEESQLQSQQQLQHQAQPALQQTQQQTQLPQIQQPQVQQPQGQQQQALQHLQHLAQQQVSQHPQQLHQQPQQQNAPQYTQEQYKQILWQQAQVKAQQAQQQRAHAQNPLQQAQIQAQQQQQARQQAQQQSQLQQHAQKQQHAQRQQHPQHTQQLVRQPQQPVQATSHQLHSLGASSAPPTSTHFVQNGLPAQGTNQTPISNDDMLAVQTAAMQARLADAAAQRGTIPSITQQPGVNSAPSTGFHHPSATPSTPLHILQLLQDGLQTHYADDKAVRETLVFERNQRFSNALREAFAIYDAAMAQADSRSMERTLAIACDAVGTQLTLTAERVGELEANLQREKEARSKAEIDKAAVQRLLDDQKQMYQRDVGTLRNEVAQSRNKHAAIASSSLQAQKTEHDKAIAALRSAFVESEEERVKLQKELDALKTSHSQCQDRIQRNNTKMAEIAGAETRHVADAVAAAKAEAETEITALKRKNERESATAKRDVNKADKMIRELKAKCVDLEAKHTELEEGLRRETARADAAEQKCEAQAGELEVAREHLSDFESGARVKELEDDVERLVANKTRLQQDLERARMTAQHNAEQVQAVAEGVDFVAAQAGFTLPSAARRELTAEQAAKAVSNLNRVVMGLTAARDRANERKARIRGPDVKQLQRSCDELLQEKDNLEAERNALRKELDAATEKIKAAEKQSQAAAPATKTANTTPASKSTNTTPAHSSADATSATNIVTAAPVNKNASITPANKGGSATFASKSTNTTPANKSASATPANKGTSATPASKGNNSTPASTSTAATSQVPQKEAVRPPSDSTPQTSRAGAMDPPATTSGRPAESARVTAKTTPTATHQASKTTTSTTTATPPTNKSVSEVAHPSTPRRRNDRDTVSPMTPLAGTKRLPADTPEGEIPPSQRRRLGLTPAEEDLFKWIRENQAVFHGRKPTPDTPSHCKLCLVEYGRSHPKVAVEERPMTPFGSEDPEDIAQHLLLEHARQIAMIREDKNRTRRKSSAAR